MDSNQAVIAAALRSLDPGMPVAQAEHAARLTAAALDHAGVVAVKLPEQGTDGMGQATWSVADGSSWNPRVTVQEPDGRIVLDSVPMAFRDPQVALSLAAALIGAALHRIEQDSDDE